MRFKDRNSVASSEWYYDLFEGGYLEPEDFLEDEEDIKKVQDAMEIINNYLSNLEDEGLLEEC